MRRVFNFPAHFYLTKITLPIDTIAIHMTKRHKFKKMQFEEHFPIPVTSIKRCPCCQSYNVHPTRPKMEYSFGYIIEDINWNTTYVCMECEELFKVPETILPATSGFFF